MGSAYINAIATAVPHSDVHATFVNYVPHLLPTKEQKRIFQSMARRTGIEHRYSVLTAHPQATQLDAENFYIPHHFPDTAARMKRYKNDAFPLAAQALDRLFQTTQANAITHIIVTSCTGFYAPGIDLDIIQHYGLSPTIERTIIGFMGCQAAMNGLKAANHIVRSKPDAQVLMLNIELCTLHLKETQDLGEMLSYLIFADGCAASLISAKPEGIAIERFHSTILPDSAGYITWHIGQSGFDMVLSREVPSKILAQLGNALTGILDDYRCDNIDCWAIHPGGSSILDAVEEAAKLPAHALRYSRDILRRYGNMSSATVMFVLKEFLERTPKGKKGCAMAFGPGMSADSMIFETCGVTAPAKGMRERAKSADELVDA